MEAEEHEGLKQRERARDRDCAYREKERRREGEAARQAVKVERVNEIPP